MQTRVTSVPRLKKAHALVLEGSANYPLLALNQKCHCQLQAKTLSFQQEADTGRRALPGTRRRSPQIKLHKYRYVAEQGAPHKTGGCPSPLVSLNQARTCALKRLYRLLQSEDHGTRQWQFFDTLRASVCMSVLAMRRHITNGTSAGLRCRAFGPDEKDSDNIRTSCFVFLPLVFLPSPL